VNHGRALLNWTGGRADGIEGGTDSKIGCSDRIAPEQVLWGTVRDEIPGVQYVCTVGDAQRLPRVLLYQQDGEARSSQILDDMKDLANQAWGETQTGLVEQQHAWHTHQGTRNRE
jgi:hypothetical protein